MSKSKDDTWTRKFRERLENYEFPVSGEVWERIESDLPSRQKPVARRIWRPIAAAAAVALLLGTGWYFAAVRPDFGEKNGDGLSGSLAPVEPRILPGPAVMPEVSEMPEHAKPAVRSHAFKRTIAARSGGNGAGASDVAALAGSRDSVLPVPENALRDIDGATEADAVAAAGGHRDEVLPDAAGLFSETPARRTDASRQKLHRPFTLALAYGSHQGSSPASHDMGEWYPQAFSMTNRITDDALPDNISATDVRHDMPLAVSLSVRKYFAPHWAWESGLTYTFLKSTETRHFPNGNTSSKDIRLHYLGIPLKIVYSFSVSRRLSLYASAGGMAEKCVSGRESFGKAIARTDVPELQYSLSGSIGLNYSLIDAFGLFVEPGAGYYFDDHSSIRTIRKDRPWNVGVQMGFRLSY
jgi:hypothetical protein